MDSRNIPALSAQRISAQLRSSARAIEVRSVAVTGSTNADLLALVEQLAGPTLLIAAEQTAGRGRAGRSWESSAATSLTFSLAWRFARPLHDLMGLPLAVGVALAEALRALNIQIRLKWPNDLLRDGRKVGGVLLETLSGKTPDIHSWVVIGVGLNLQLPTDIARAIQQPAAALPELMLLERELLVAELVSGLADALLQFEQYGFMWFCERWNSLHAYAEKMVAILEQGRVVQRGRAHGVDANGCLLLQTATGVVPVVAGDVSLRIQVE
ncbi:MAG: biotin--[acetyl-CoA-carboxylase] ligase [Herbaspirillum sp.]